MPYVPPASANSSADIQPNFYDDVSPSHWAYSYIKNLSDKNIVSGIGNNKFGPSMNITREAFLRMILGAALDTELTRGQTMRMIYNCLDAKRMISSITSGNDIEMKIADETFRDLLLGDEDEGLKKIEGVVTANREMYLGNAIADMDDNMVEIGGTVYYVGTTDIAQCFGMSVKAYIQANPNGVYDIVKNYELTKDNSSFEIDITDVSSITSERITYAENDKQKAYKTGIDIQFLYNVRQITGRIREGIEEVESDDPQDEDIPAIAAQNESVNGFYTADEVNFDRSKYGSEDLKRALRLCMEEQAIKYLPVSYKLDSNDKIKKIELLEKMPVVPEAYYSDGTKKTVIPGEKKYNAYEKSFGGKANGEFGLSDSTLGICVPSNEVMSMNDYLARIEMNHGKTYEVQITSTPPIYIFDTSKSSDEKMTLGTSDDFLASQLKAVVVASYNVVKAVVIIK